MRTREKRRVTSSSADDDSEMHRLKSMPTPQEIGCLKFHRGLDLIRFIATLDSAHYGIGGSSGYNYKAMELWWPGSPRRKKQAPSQLVGVLSMEVI